MGEEAQSCFGIGGRFRFFFFPRLHACRACWLGKQRVQSLRRCWSSLLHAGTYSCGRWCGCNLPSVANVLSTAQIMTLDWSCFRVPAMQVSPNASVRRVQYLFIFQLSGWRLRIGYHEFLADKTDLSFNWTV